MSRTASGARGEWKQMSRDEVITHFVRTALSLEAIVVLVVCVGILALAGRLSLRFLRTLPDFDSKAKMMWGAKWAWAVLLAGPVLAFAGAYLGMRFTHYLATSGMAGALLLTLVFPLAFLLLRDQMSGVMAALYPLGARLKGQSFEFDEWLKHQRQIPSKQRVIRLMAHVGMFMLPAVVLYYAVTGTYPLDREIIELERVLRLVETLNQELKSDLVKALLPQVPLHQEPYELWVKVSADTSEVEAEGLVRRTRQTLADLGEKRQWRIVVTDCPKQTFATGMYIPQASGSPGGPMR